MVSPQAKPNPQQVARAGEHFVAAELHRRGVYAVTFAGNMPRIDVLAADKEQTRTVFIQVKTKRSGDWQTSILRGHERQEDPADAHFWIFVNLGRGSEPPEFYIVPEWWIENDIYEAHAAYLARHGGQRTRSPGSTHHAIKRTRIAMWRDRWDLLGLVKNAVPTDARELVMSLVGREIRTLGGRPNHVIGIEGDNVMVGTRRSPQGQPVPLAEIQTSLDVLRTDGEVTIDVTSVGYRSAFIGAVLKSIAGTTAERSPPRVFMGTPGE